jgi:hypothetical protein
MTAPGTPVEKVRNLGPKSAALLREVGIRTYAELANVGAIEAFRRARAFAPHRVSLNLLYALEGALTNTHWNQLPEPVREELRAAVEQE